MPLQQLAGVAQRVIAIDGTKVFIAKYQKQSLEDLKNVYGVKILTVKESLKTL